VDVDPVDGAATPWMEDEAGEDESGDTERDVE
jgi:hypothetical protein